VKKFAAAALVLLAVSCSEPLRQTDFARKAFEDWAKAAAAGDAEKTLAGFTDAKKSEWLFERFVEDDEIVRRWRGRLTGEPRTNLDLWLGVVKRQGSGRASVLPPNVLDHPSFVDMFREYFAQTAKAIRDSLSRVQIAEVYGDDSGITVAVKTSPGSPTVLYGLLYENNGWKIDVWK
jgi:hypothetical protein